MTWRLLLEYDGTDYVGWQRQSLGISIQELVEQALKRVMGGEAIHVLASGRTDSGVHALGQVASFRCYTHRAPHAVRMGLNSLLPGDVSCRHAERAPDGFHAIQDATSKVYRYRIQDTGERSPLRGRYTWHLRGPLDLSAMEEAIQLVVGRRDFSSFRASGSAARTSVRTLRSVRIVRVDDEVHLLVEGEGFLRHMVRIMTGTLVDVGRGRYPPSRVAEILAARSRLKAGRTAPASGLCLMEVRYGEPRSSIPQERVDE